MQTAARSLELFFVDGDPEGLLTAEVFNWTGHVLHAPRTRLSDALQRKEASHTGVYLLIGEKDGNPLAYVGEAEDIAQRIRRHDVSKEWWSVAVLITTAANNLNKAHVRYLEARLIEQAKEVGRVELENGLAPSRPSLSEAALSNMEEYLNYLFMALPALRIDLFVSRRRGGSSKSPTVVNPAKDDPTFELVLKRASLRASAVLRDGEFVVQAGSDARDAWIGSVHSGYAQLHSELVRNGILATHGRNRVFTEDYAFRSTSAAAAVVTGRNAAGPDSWTISGEKKTYKEWERDELSRASGDAT